MFQPTWLFGEPIGEISKRVFGRRAHTAVVIAFILIIVIMIMLAMVSTVIFVIIMLLFMMRFPSG